MNPFETARVRRDAIQAVLKATDLIDAEPSLTTADAERLLVQYGVTIASGMIRAGIAVALQLKGAEPQ